MGRRMVRATADEVASEQWMITPTFQTDHSISEETIISKGLSENDRKPE